VAAHIRGHALRATRVGAASRSRLPSGQLRAPGRASADDPRPTLAATAGMPLDFAAGRTDAGVHALGQVAHFDLAKETTADTVRDALNFHLKPAPVAVLKAEAVGEDFHARFSAKARLYRYRIANRRPPLALDRGRAWLVWGELDAASMQEAAQILGLYRPTLYSKMKKHDIKDLRAQQRSAAAATPSAPAT